jgi:hypothetical protein
MRQTFYDEMVSIRIYFVECSEQFAGQSSGRCEAAHLSAAIELGVFESNGLKSATNLVKRNGSVGDPTCCKMDIPDLR